MRRSTCPSLGKWKSDRVEDGPESERVAAAVMRRVGVSPPPVSGGDGGPRAELVLATRLARSGEEGGLTPYRWRSQPGPRRAGSAGASRPPAPTQRGLRRVALLPIALLALTFAGPAAGQERAERGLKIYISADMEGVTGVVTDEQLGPSGFEYSRFREFMTAEVNAAIEGALAAGATEIVVSDSHGNGQNLLIEKLPQDITIVRAWPRPLMMMQGIDDSFDGAVFIGYHASTTNPEGVRAHTMSSARLADVRLNGVSVPEAGINAAIAGHFGVPVIMISGDDALMKEVRELLGEEFEAAVVKWAIGFHSARSLMPEAGQRLIREKVQAAVERIDEFELYRPRSPITVEVTFKNYRPAEVLALLPIVERADAHTIRFVGKDIVEVSRFLEFMLYYEPGLAP